MKSLKINLFLALPIMIILGTSCSKEQVNQQKNQLKTSDTCLIKIANIDSIGIPHLAIDSSRILNAYQTYMNNYNDDSLNIKYYADSLNFNWYYNDSTDVESLANRQFYLIIYGHKFQNDEFYVYSKIATELIRIENEVFFNRCNDNKSIGVTYSYECINKGCAAGCEWVYAWHWWIFHGRITNCTCPETPGECEFHMGVKHDLSLF